MKMDAAEIISSCLTQYYDGGANIPDEIIIPCHLPDEAVIAEWLTDKKEKKVVLTIPSRGTKNALVDMAVANARSLWESRQKKEEQKTEALKILQEKLSLAKIPQRIECYDISNISGKHAVGSMVVFQDGEPDKSSYRRFRIKTVSEADDYAMMYEVLSRRFVHNENLPDLVVVDGGKGQLNVALSVLKDLKIKLDVIGLAKEERTIISSRGIMQKKERKSEDRVYLARRKDAIYLSAWPQALRMLQQVRDEAHRFAVSYHRQLKQNDDLRCVLDAVDDIGEVRKQILLTHFGSVRQIKNVSLEELQRVPGISKKLAGKIYTALSLK
jgi:excinuclease ABC subunit C